MSETIQFVLLLIGAYLLGSVPAAYLVGKWSRGIDIRQYGSGNVGATNLMGIASKRVAIPVIIFDVVKGLVTVWVAHLMGLGIVYQVLVGLVTISGHNWPIFLRFSGGRGLLTTLGVALILPAVDNLVPWEIVAFLGLAGIGIFIFHNLPLGVNVGVAAMPVVSWGVDEPLPLTLGFLAMFLVGAVRRLTVPRAAITGLVSYRQLFINRLLFDRDIRDREIWIHRAPTEASLIDIKKCKGKVD